LLAWAFGFSSGIGIGFGMLGGALAGVVMDAKQPRRTRWVAAGFALGIAAVVLFTLRLYP
jgi:hypothetical protein